MHEQKRDYTAMQSIINDSFISVYKQWRKGDITATKAIGLCSMSRAGFYKVVKEYEAQA